MRACCTISEWESLFLPPIMLSMMEAGNMDGIVWLGNVGIMSRMDRRCDLYCDIVGQASIV